MMECRHARLRLWCNKMRAGSSPAEDTMGVSRISVESGLSVKQYNLKESMKVRPLLLPLCPRKQSKYASLQFMTGSLTGILS